METIGVQGKFLEYKGKPLVRQGNELYYGDFSDSHYLFMMIMSEKDAATANVKIPDKVMVQIIATADQKIEKQKVVNGLYEAFDFGTAWLERAIKQ